MRHVEVALGKMAPEFVEGQVPAGNLPFSFIEIENAEDTKGVAPVVKFTIQSDPISEVGVNGCQASDMLEYVTHLFESLNSGIPNNETVKTIEALKEAAHWQNERTKNRTARGVEGTMQE
jgi:hypothetical protein